MKVLGFLAHIQPIVEATETTFQVEVTVVGVVMVAVEIAETIITTNQVMLAETVIAVVGGGGSSSSRWCHGSNDVVSQKI